VCLSGVYLTGEHRLLVLCVSLQSSRMYFKSVGDCTHGHSAAGHRSPTHRHCAQYVHAVFVKPRTPNKTRTNVCPPVRRKFFPVSTKFGL